jgi:hypothetical protein
LGKRFVAALIQKFFDVSWDFWQHRNHFLHKPDAMARALLIRQMDVHISEQHHRGMEDSPQRCSYLFNGDIQKLLNKSIRAKLLWLEAVSHSCMRKKVGDNDFDKTTDTDIQLIEKVRAIRLLSARTKQSDEPELRTKSEQKKKRLLAVQ